MTVSVESAPARGGDRLRLAALLDGHLVGHVYQAPGGRLRFAYTDRWREHRDTYPLSLAMPIVAREHGHEAIHAFLWGLLPDNSHTLDQYARLFGVSASNPVALLAKLGADCAGAVQFAPPERLDALLTAGSSSPEIEWLDAEQVAAELRSLREQGIPGTDQRTAGQFSLAGTQPKIALLAEDGRWGRPSGRTPTNTILKPPSQQFPGIAENEHLCLKLAEAIGLLAVHSRVMRFEDEVAIVIDRFDRVRRGGGYQRIHQEDICQALGVMPTRKYENEGGPGVRDIVALLRDTSHEPEVDLDRFLGAIALNWLLAATDGHAKNFALLHGPGGATRLAPLYDIVSVLPYSDPGLHRVKLAMKVGSEYQVRRIHRAHWEDLAKSIGAPRQAVMERVTRVVESVARSLGAVEQAAITDGLDAQVINALADRVRGRVSDCSGVLAR